VGIRRKDSKLHSKTISRFTTTPIVPKLADEGCYIASESTFYREIVCAAKLNAHRGTSKPKTNEKPKHYVAKALNEIWSGDLYMIIDIFSRKYIWQRF
jgi:putative transposase